MTEKDTTATDVAGLIERLKEYRGLLLRVGDQQLVQAAADALDAQRQEIERHDAQVKELAACLRLARTAIKNPEEFAGSMGGYLWEDDLLKLIDRALIPSQEAEHG